MTSERWRKLEALYHAAREHGSSERAAFLSDACQGDDELRRDVEALLAQDSVDNILDRPAAELLDPESSVRTLAQGDKLGHYEIVALIGAGGMGQVYKARDPRLRRSVALKVLPSELSRDPARIRRFEREARAIAALNHPNIVAIHDVGQDNGVYFIVTELIDGEPLRPSGRSVREAFEIAIQIASGLDAAHQAGVFHRDLKPANILVARDGRVKILDFGLAKLAPGGIAGQAASTDSATLETSTGVVMGTPGYMSPEQVKCQASDHRSDIFSFGIILYELLGSDRAFPGASVESRAAILRADPAELGESVPSGVRQIVARCLEKDPANRFQSARELHVALSANAPQSDPGKVPAVTTALKIWLIRAVAALALVAAGAVGARLFWRAAPSPVWTGMLLGASDVPGSPRPSPDGHWVAFLDVDASSTSQVALMKPETGSTAILTHAAGQGHSRSLSWSADSTKIYYDRWTDVPRGIYSVPVLGGEERLVVEGAAYPEALPDGSLLVEELNADRQFQLFRYWLETNRWYAFPLELKGLVMPGAVRSFPDGREAVAVGTPIGPGRENGAHLYAIDLDSGKLRRLETGARDDSKISAVGVTRDGRSVLAAIVRGNVEQITAIPRSGRGAMQALLTLTETTWSLDTGPDGSIYLDQVDRPAHVRRFSPQGGPDENIATLPAYQAPGAPSGPDQSFAVLPDGRAVLTRGTGGRMSLMVVEAGKAPYPLVTTTEENSAPVTVAGPGAIAFLIGPEPKRTIAVAALSNGRITRRIPFDKGPITSLASSPDGKMLYCAAGRAVWQIPLDLKEPRKLRAGDYIALDPEGGNLLVEVVESPVIRLIQVPLDGGPEREIPRTSTLRLASMIGPNAIGKDGRILMPLRSAERFLRAGVIDPLTGTISRIPADNAGDLQVLGWTPDGKVMALGLELHSKIWKFQIERR